MAALAAPAPSLAGSHAPTAEQRSAKLPRRLVAFERKMRGLTLNSMGVQLAEMEHGPRLQDRRSTARSEVEESRSPPLLVIRSHELGGTSQQTVEETRVIGSREYAEEAFAEQIYGGRPWVERAIGGSRKGRGGGQETGDVGAEPLLGSWTKRLAAATSAKEVGPVVIDGHRGTKFLATLDPRKLSGRRAIGSPKGASYGQFLEDLHAKVTLGVCFEPNGLPVQMSFAIRIGDDTNVEARKIVATEIPVSVEPPPASETISAAELKRVEGMRESEEVK